MVVDVAKLLDENRIGSFQIRVFILCAIVAPFDGYDLLVIGFTAQPIAAALQVNISALGPKFAAAQVGFMVGSFVFADVSQSHNGQTSMEDRPPALIEIKRSWLSPD